MPRQMEIPYATVILGTSDRLLTAVTQIPETMQKIIVRYSEEYNGLSTRTDWGTQNAPQEDFFQLLVV